MSKFKILTLSASDDSVSRSCVDELTRCIEARGAKYSLTDIRDLPPLWVDNRPIERYPEAYQRIYRDVLEADGVYLLLPIYCFSASGNSKAITEVVAPALTQKPCAMLVSQGSHRSHLAIRDLMNSMTFEQQTFCYPKVVQVTRDDLDDAWIPSTELCARIDAFVSEFTVYAATVKLFLKVASQPSDHQKHQLDVLRVNHLNVLTTNLQDSLSFYEEILGVRYLYNLGPYKAVTELAGFEFFIEQVPEVWYPDGFHFGVRTTKEGVFALYDRLQRRGVKFVKGNGPAAGAHLGPDQVRSALYFEDPDGLMIEVYSPELALLERSAALLDE